MLNRSSPRCSELWKAFSHATTSKSPFAVFISTGDSRYAFARVPAAKAKKVLISYGHSVLAVIPVAAALLRLIAAKARQISMVLMGEVERPGVAALLGVASLLDWMQNKAASGVPR